MTLSTMTWRLSSSTGTCWVWRPHCGEEACAGAASPTQQSLGSPRGYARRGLEPGFGLRAPPQWLVSSLVIRLCTFVPMAATPGRAPGSLQHEAGSS